MNEAPAPDDNPHVLDDDDFDELEALLVSEVVPEDCMNLEMLDGYLAAVLVSPTVVPAAAWLPAVWSAHADDASFASGSRMQRVIGLVLRYHNELATTIGQPDGWEPFCYASQGDQTFEVGEEWAEGFAQGLETWPERWPEEVPDAVAESVQARLDDLLSAWSDEQDEASGEPARKGDAPVVTEAERIQWLETARTAVADIGATWTKLGLARPVPLEVGSPARMVGSGGPGRNDPCSCGSGKKYKKCCGANL
ncbi:MAG: UPF0149 family protein [Rhodocyclaceae bacterium]